MKDEVKQVRFIKFPFIFPFCFDETNMRTNSLLSLGLSQTSASLVPPSKPLVVPPPAG